MATFHHNQNDMIVNEIMAWVDCPNFNNPFVDAWVFHDDDVVAFADETAIDDWLVWCAYDGI